MNLKYIFSTNPFKEIQTALSKLVLFYLGVSLAEAMIDSSIFHLRTLTAQLLSEIQSFNFCDFNFWTISNYLFTSKPFPHKITFSLHASWYIVHWLHLYIFLKIQEKVCLIYLVDVCNSHYIGSCHYIPNIISINYDSCVFLLFSGQQKAIQSDNFYMFYVNI